MITDTLAGSVRTIRVEDGGLGYSTGTELLLVEEDERNIRVLPSSSTIGKVIGLNITNPGARFSNNFTMVPETTIPTSMQLVNLGNDIQILPRDMSLVKEYIKVMSIIL